MTTTTMEKKESDVSCVECTHEGRMYVPNVDIIENQEELHLLADVPGATAEDIDIRLNQGELSIHARIPNRQSDQTRFLAAEYGVGDYFRTFAVGEDIDNQAISATVNGGVLTLRLPKIERAKPRKIAVVGQ